MNEEKKFKWYLGEWTVYPWNSIHQLYETVYDRMQGKQYDPEQMKEYNLQCKLRAVEQRQWREREQLFNKTTSLGTDINSPPVLPFLWDVTPPPSMLVMLNLASWDQYIRRSLPGCLQVRLKWESEYPILKMPQPLPMDMDDEDVWMETRRVWAEKHGAPDWGYQDWEDDEKFVHHFRTWGETKRTERRVRQEIRNEVR